MRLPNAENAEIPESKITKYLLSTTHRAGKSKASFFMQFGFDLNHWKALALALKEHVLENEVVLEEKTIFGTRYIVDGLLKAPDGRWLNVRAAWYITTDRDVPRFITAHPLRRRRS
jgi:hypothetical protein